MVKAAILRLMSYRSLSRSVRLGPEDMISLDFATRLRAASIEGRLDAVWFHVANELAHGHRTGVAAAIARALGMHRGVSDYIFLHATGALVLEAKSRTGRLHDGQVDFRDWCTANGVPFHIIRSADEGEAILRQKGLLR